MKVQALNRFLEYDPGYVAPCKEALTLLGLPAGPVRRPLPDLTTEERAGVRQALVDLGLLS
jgi:dihydrodipicolinate synthase/N-acetylneuraminate lyase